MRTSQAGRTGRALTLLIVLQAAVLLAGCAQPGNAPPATTCEDDFDIPEGHTLLRVLVARPTYTNEYGFVKLWVHPEQVALLRNDTSLGAYYDDLTVGRTDWMADQSLWYEGFVPAGKYNFIRLSVNEDIEGVKRDGSEPEVRVRFGRLTVTTADPDGKIELPEGRCFTVLHEPAMAGQSENLYEIADRVQ